jgi:hypothetical protein
VIHHFIWRYSTSCPAYKGSQISMPSSHAIGASLPEWCAGISDLRMLESSVRQRDTVIVGHSVIARHIFLP